MHSTKSNQRIIYELVWREFLIANIFSLLSILSNHFLSIITRSKDSYIEKWILISIVLIIGQQILGGIMMYKYQTKNNPTKFAIFIGILSQVILALYVPLGLSTVLIMVMYYIFR